MAASAMHLIHLKEKQANWLTLERTGRRLRLVAGGSIAEPPERSLAAWAAAHRKPGVPVRIVDGRPRYFQVRFALPQAAMRGLTGAIELKVRQEVGLPSEQMAWGVRLRRRGGEGGMIDIETTVARRQDVQSLNAWAAELHTGALWIGADVDAAGALARTVAPGKPLLVLDGSTPDARLFHIDATGIVAVERIGDQHGASPLLSESLAEGATCLAFGLHLPEGLRPLADRDAAARDQAKAAVEQLLRSFDTSPDSEPGAVAARDAVLLGALAELAEPTVAPAWLRWAPAGSATERTGISAERRITPPGFVTALEERLPPTRTLVVAAIGGAVLLAGALAWHGAASARAAKKLEEHAISLRVAGEIYRSQQQVLSTVAAERRPLMPVIEAVHRAAPKEVQVHSLTVTQGGALQLDCTTQNREAADAFRVALARSPLLQRVELPVIQPRDDRINFQLTAQIVDRQRRR